MGHGIALVFAQAGHAVALHDAVPAALAGARERLSATLAQIGGDARCVDRIALHENLAEAVAGADFVIEAIPERLPLKRAFFADVERFAPAQAILCSNTSALPITALGAELARPGRLVGTHFWNPPYLIPLVEVISSPATESAVAEATLSLLRGAGKVPVHVLRDVPGFIGNRLQHALWREAFAIVEAGICDAETVDTVVKNSFGIRLAVLGPLENADLVGLDLTRDIHATLLADLATAGEPSPLLDEHIGRGELGMKSGRGMRDWPAGTADDARARLQRHLLRAQRGLTLAN